jgi:ABC-type Fe3+ transport system substrate-binding protein
MIARGYTGGTQRVAAGEVGIFWFASITTAVHLALKGAPIDLIAFPKFPISYSAFGILKDAAHPAASWLLIDYLTSPEGQFEYTDAISPKVTLNRKATPGKLAKWMVEHGAGIENGDPTDPSMAPKLYNEKVLKKSEDFFFKLLGIK